MAAETKSLERKAGLGGKNEKLPGGAAVPLAPGTYAYITTQISHPPNKNYKFDNI